uniref:DUF148 domain-containing protein n=1 Tax=Panagrellus redivivus TaxID=6233 RepID=A0A7E4V2W0_PANRE
MELPGLLKRLDGTSRVAIMNAISRVQNIVGIQHVMEAWATQHFREQPAVRNWIMDKITQTCHNQQKGAMLVSATNPTTKDAWNRLMQIGGSEIATNQQIVDTVRIILSELGPNPHYQHRAEINDVFRLTYGYTLDAFPNMFADLLHTSFGRGDTAGKVVDSTNRLGFDRYGQRVGLPSIPYAPYSEDAKPGRAPYGLGDDFRRRHHGVEVNQGLIDGVYNPTDSKPGYGAKAFDPELPMYKNLGYNPAYPAPFFTDEKYIRGNCASISLSIVLFFVAFVL